MKNKSKRQFIDENKTVFTINNTNRGQIDLSQFYEKSESKTSRKIDRDEKQIRNSNAETKNVKKGASKHGKRGGKKRNNVGSEPREKDAVGLRVIGGKFRGSRLAYSGNNRVRPMKDRVREAVFNLIGPVVRGKNVIDLFGGTGALAIEALSRGAVSATVIEMHLPTAVLLRDNFKALGLSAVYQLCKTDAFFWAKNCEAQSQDGISWIVFCSPPYSFYVEREADVLEMLGKLVEVAPMESVFVIESDNRFDFNKLPIKPTENKIRSYPPAEIAIFVKTFENVSTQMTQDFQG
ncbi:MAG: RsmD family RNA methyltransferase [Planctomycetaceae bacterium]|jgi:16S rRNA (guanine(966)-N(2))-methyltransferase RsmD|nr:RsmD family RNA methyltransferase [Planctomycetaceae bacterium]